MSDNLIIEIQKAGDGRTLALINGKLYTLLAGYDDHRAGGWFFLAVAGRTPLKAEDLDQHWQVVKSGPIYLAFAQRPFSYHLAQGEGTEPPYGCDWPRLKAPPYHFAFVGPTQEAVETQVLLALEQFRPDLSPEDVLDRAIRVPDEAGPGPDALLVRMSPNRQLFRNLRGVLPARAPLLHIMSGGKPMEDPTMTELLRRAVALMLDKLNEHNPETGFLFAIDHGLTEYLTMLTLVHACARDAIPMARALETIKHMEEKHHARHARNH